MGRYRLTCRHPDCDAVYERDDHYRLECDRVEAHGPALLRAEYDEPRLTIRPELPGVFRYADWMPTGPYAIDPPGPPLGNLVCFRSHGMAARLGLENLFIAFAGFWPERGAAVLTRSFKEYEVQASIARYLSSNGKGPVRPLIVSSAGNTANAYNLLAHQLGMPIYLVLPEAGVDKMVVPFETRPFALAVRGDYLDAIELADRIQAAAPLARDGGVKNVARRAGMGAVMLHAVADPESGIGRTFDHYFQAVGSAAGAIAAWEAVELLLADGRFGKTRTRIHMAQNDPFTPIPDSWTDRSRTLRMPDGDEARRRIAAATAQVLTNRHPPYSIPGGIYDVLSASDGATWRVRNYDLFQAARMFKETEGADIGEASAVAVSALAQAVDRGAVNRDDTILLNITGGGLELQHARGPEYRVEPVRTVDAGDLEGALEAIGEVAPIGKGRDYLSRYED